MQLGAVTAKTPWLVVIMSVPWEDRDVECRYVGARLHNDPRLARANTRRIRAIGGESIIRASNIFAPPLENISLCFFFSSLSPLVQFCGDFRL